MEAGRRPLFAGVDIGGTTISVGLVDEHGDLYGSPKDVAAMGGKGLSTVWWEPMGEDHTPTVIAGRLAGLIRAALEEAKRPLGDLQGVGVSVPGLLDLQKGIVNAAANLKGWRMVPLCALIAEHLHLTSSVRVVLENDTNAALLAEAWTGACKDCQNVVLLTLGTGIGGAILCDGRLLRGSKGHAGEVGHSILVPDGREHGGAGVKGIFEAYASCTAVVDRARLSGGPPADSPLSGGPQPLQCSGIFKQAEQTGDAFASRLVKETARYLAVGLINCCCFVDPEVIILGGGMSEAGEFLLREVREQFAAILGKADDDEPVGVRINCASAGSHAGVLGAAKAAMLATQASSC